MILDLGLIDYEKACRIQKEFVNRRKIGEIDDSILFAEHDAVFTIGRSGREDNLLVSLDFLEKNNIKVLRVDRGGDITFHGPGQLLIYPILDLRERGKDLHRYLRDLEEAVIKFLSGYSITADRLEGKTGVWVAGKKIASIGVAASNWVTFHGVSVNINVDLRFFSMINPCGMKDSGVTSMGRVLGADIAMCDARQALTRSFSGIFRLEDEKIAKR